MYYSFVFLFRIISLKDRLKLSGCARQQLSYSSFPSVRIGKSSNRKPLQRQLLQEQLIYKEKKQLQPVLPQMQYIKHPWKHNAIISPPIKQLERCSLQYNRKSIFWLPNIFAFDFPFLDCFCLLHHIAVAFVA